MFLGVSGDVFDQATDSEDGCRPPVTKIILPERLGISVSSLNMILAITLMIENSNVTVMSKVRINAIHLEIRNMLCTPLGSIN